MDDMWTRIFGDIADRLTGPLKFRLVLQPAMALVLATIAGLKDARAGKAPYFYGLFTSAGHRREMLENGWKSVGKLFVLALLLDVVYQFIVLRFVYAGEALIVALVLAIVPYLIVRGLVTRIARK